LTNTRQYPHCSRSVASNEDKEEEKEIPSNIEIGHAKSI